MFDCSYQDELFRFVPKFSTDDWVITKPVAMNENNENNNNNNDQRGTIRRPLRYFTSGLYKRLRQQFD